MLLQFAFQIESKAEILLLKSRCHALESSLLPSTEDVEEATESRHEPRPVIKDLLIVGGFDGSSWLPDLCSYLPYEDIMSSLTPMSIVREYSSAVTTNGKLYVLGGADGDLWHDTGVSSDSNLNSSIQKPLSSFITTMPYLFSSSS